MREILAFRSRGKGTFALRKDLKALSGTVCDLRRNPENVHGTTFDGSIILLIDSPSNNPNSQSAQLPVRLRIRSITHSRQHLLHAVK